LMLIVVIGLTAVIAWYFTSSVGSTSQGLVDVGSAESSAARAIAECASRWV